MWEIQPGQWIEWWLVWAAVELGEQPEVVLPEPWQPAGVDYLKAQESGKPERRSLVHTGA